jgi:hypothetical protein
MLEALHLIDVGLMGDALVNVFADVILHRY